MNKVVHFTYISLILILFVLFVINFIYKEDDKFIIETMKVDSFNYNQIRDINLEQINSDNISISDTLLVLNENGERILISAISEVGSENVICLLNSDNPRIIRSFKRTYHISCDVYGLSIGYLSPVLEVSNTVVAYYFCVLSKECLMENCFINIQEFPERTNAYFKSIKRKFSVLDDR